ncbi:MAG: VOC family protein [Sandaracinus sp.]
MSEPPSGGPPKPSSRPPPGAVEVAPPTAVHHLAVKVRDLDRAEAFYVGVLGLTITRRHVDERGRPRSFWVAIGTGFLAIERAERAEPVRADDTPGWHCIALAIPIEAREAWRARLAEKGFPVLHETAYTLYVRDPEGAVVALSHHPVSITGVKDESADPAATPAGVTARLAALVSLSAVLLALFTGGATASAQRRATAPAVPDDVLLVGSSSVDGAFGRLIESELEHAGMRVGRVGHPATGLARPDYFDWHAEIARLGDLHALRGVLVLLGGNDTQPLRLTDDEARTEGHSSIRWADEARWRALYAARVTHFVDALCAAGAPRVLVVLPTDGASESWSERVHRVQETQIAGTRASRCGAIVDPRAVRTRDERSTVDGVHLSRRGSRAVWEAIAPVVQRALAS